MRKEDLLGWAGSGREPPQPGRGLGGRPHGFRQKSSCIPVTKSYASLSLGREEKLFLNINCVIANRLLSWAK